MKRLAAAMALSLTAACTHRARVAPVTDGRAVLAQMHDHYAGKWYNTLTFQQKTDINRRDGTHEVQTWYESLKGPHWLRIDQGLPSLGNGVLYSSDSVYLMRGGQLTRAVNVGNPFIPLIMGVYLQPVDRTIADLAPYHFNLDQMHRGELDGRPVYVVGTEDPVDSISPQFEVDTERLILLRMRVGFGPPGSPLADAHLMNLVETGGGWLATKVAIANGGNMQTEEYADWHTRMDLSDALFDVHQWTTAPHWAH
ncbi:MAG TPA: hypothetical protein VGI92_06635 [Gemmatimonadales bacterium]|jgi:hypothetical protein